MNHVEHTLQEDSSVRTQITSTPYAIVAGLVSIIPLYSYPVVVLIEVLLIAQIARNYGRSKQEITSAVILLVLVSLPIHLTASAFLGVLVGIGWVVNALITFVAMRWLGEMLEYYYSRHSAGRANVAHELIRSVKSLDTAMKTATVFDGIVRDVRSDALLGTAALLATVFVDFLRQALAAQRYEMHFAIAGGIFIAALQCRLLITRYRVAVGLFGTNRYEARLIVKHIISTSDDRDFTNGLGARELILDSDTNVLIAEAWGAGV